MKYYQEFKDKNGYIYSLDMVRYNFHIFSGSNLFDFIRRFGFESGVELKYTLNSKSVGYKHFWNIKISDDNITCSFAIGMELNYIAENRNSGFIEFNPNKCMPCYLFEAFWNSFCSYCNIIELVRYDVAIDIPLPRSKVKMIRSSKCSYEYQYHDGKDGLILNSSVTEYQGKRNSNKFTKLYDKTKESHLDYDLTRIEYTFTREEKQFKNLPKFYVYDPNQINFDLDYNSISSTQMVLIDLLRNSEDINYYLKNLPYRIKKKIEPYLCDSIFQLDLNLLKNVRDLAISFEL